MIRLFRSAPNGGTQKLVAALVVPRAVSAPAFIPFFSALSRAITGNWNPLERIIREIRWRTRVVGAFSRWTLGIDVGRDAIGKRRYLMLETLLNPLSTGGSGLKTDQATAKESAKKEADS